MTPEEKKTSAVQALMKKHIETCEALRHLVHATEEIARGKYNDDIDACFADADRVLRRDKPAHFKTAEEARASKTPAEALRDRLLQAQGAMTMTEAMKAFEATSSRLDDAPIKASISSSLADPGTADPGAMTGQGKLVKGVRAAASFLGSESDLEERWAKLLRAESILDRQREDILDALDDGADDGPAIREAIKRIVMKQSSRPTPDFRALLLKTRKALVMMAENGMVFDTMLSKVGPVAYKEALRLTDVERLEPWIDSVQGVAMRMLLEEIEDDLIEGTDHGVCEEWIEQTAKDIATVRNKPDAYLASRADRIKKAEAEKEVADMFFIRQEIRVEIKRDRVTRNAFLAWATSVNLAPIQIVEISPETCVAYYEAGACEAIKRWASDHADSRLVLGLPQGDRRVEG